MRFSEKVNIFSSISCLETSQEDEARSSVMRLWPIFQKWFIFRRKCLKFHTNISAKSEPFFENKKRENVGVGWDLETDSQVFSFLLFGI